MELPAREARIRELVDGFLRQQEPLDVYLQGVYQDGIGRNGIDDEDLRAQVSARCTEARFARGFFQGLQPLKLVPAPPTLVADCELLELLGEGAMGRVYRARQHGLDRDIALKLVHVDVADRDDFLGRFRDEAKLLGQLDHPGIVKVLFCGEADGWLHFGMERIVGHTLAEQLPELLRQLGDQTRPRRFDRIARLVAEILEALAYAHRQGIVHRDLKPSNVMLTRDGHPKLVDFGLAKAAAAPLRTVPGQVLGTPAYLSPELVAGKAGDRQLPDLWAVSVMLFQLLTGRLPYDGRNADELLQHLLRPIVQDPRRHLPDVPAPLAAICRRALAPEPADRYPTAAAFGADLQRFLAGESVHADRRTAWRRVQRHLWRARHAYVTATALAAVGASAWIGASVHAQEQAFAAAIERLPPIEAAPPDQLAARASALRTLQQDAAPGSERHTRLAALQQQLVPSAQALHAAGVDKVTRGAGQPRATEVASYRAPAPALQAAGLREIAAAQQIVPELQPAEQVLAANLPLLRIETPAGGSNASVRVDAIDPVTGQVLLPGAILSTPCSLPVDPGLYRIVIGDQHAFAECVRFCIAPGELVVTPILHPSAAAQSTMILVPAGTAVIGQDTPGAVVYARQSVQHDAFWIDRTEVTCADYHQFCVAKNQPLPACWGGSYDPAWASLPVVGVPFPAARDYAEWKGKRLPTYVEWQAAARGPSGAVFPWGTDEQRLQELDNIGRTDTPWQVGLRPVGQTPLDHSWIGVMDMLGNAEEWIDTPYVAQVDGVQLPMYAWHLLGGVAWTTDKDANVAALDIVGPAPPELPKCGFRCAKSLLP